jgi:TP901 family phage tail tape measure protein
MGKTLSVKLSVIDKISEKLEDIAAKADRVANNVSDFGNRADEAFGRATSGSQKVNEAMQTASVSASDFASQESRAQQALEEQAETADRAAQASKEQAETAETAAGKLGDYGEKADRAGKESEKLKEKVDRTGKGLEDYEEEIDRTRKGLEDYEEETDRAGKESEKYREETEKTSGAVMDLGDALAAAGIAAALNEIADAYNEFDESADAFETSMAKVGTIADTSAVSLGDIQKEIQNLSKDTGVAVSDLAESAYSAISASVDTANAVSFVEQANALAVGGFTQTTTAVDILTTALNAYQLEADQTANIADMLIQTQNLGKTTVDELAGSMGKVIPTAKSLGVELDVLCGSYAVMTANGIATAETTTYLNSMLNELGKSGSTAADALAAGTEGIKEGGLTMAEAMEMGWGLTDVLEVLDEQAQESGTSISNMFSSAEAGKAANVLWGNAAKVDSAIEQMGSSAGAAQEAFEKMSSTGEYVEQKWENALNNLKITIGNAQPSLDGLMTKGTEIVNLLSDFVEKNPEVITAITGVTVGLAAFTVSMGAYSAATLIAQKATVALTAAMDTNPVFLAVSAVAALTAGVAVLAGALSDAEDGEELLTGSSLQLADEIDRQTAAVESLTDEYGEYDERTLEAQARLDELQAEYEGTKTTIREFEQQIQATADAIKDTKEAYKEASDNLDSQSYHAQALVAELERLRSQSELTAFQQEYEKQVVEELNGIYPELGLSYDEASGRLNKSTVSLKKYCEQKKAQAKLEQDAAQYMEYEDEMSELIGQKTAAQEAFNAAQEEYNTLIAEAEMLAANGNGNENLSDYHEKMEEAETAMESARNAMEELDGQIGSLQADMDALEGSADGAADSIDGVTEASDNLIFGTYDLRDAMKGIFDGVQEQAAALAEAYQEAYSSAVSAVDGSFDLFEKIELESSQSANDMVNALKSQTEYLEEYAENLNKAKEYGLDASLVESLADGSQQSAADLDTIISKIEDLGTTTESAKGYVDDMNESFEGVQTAKQTLVDTMIEMNTSLNEQMDSLKSAVETGVSGLNLSDEAAGAAEATVSAYIAAIEGMRDSAADAAQGLVDAVESILSNTEVPYNAGYKSGASAGDGIAAGVDSAYAKVMGSFVGIGKDSNKALNRVWQIKSPSRLFKESSQYAMEGIIEGVDEKEEDVITAFENVAGVAAEGYEEKIAKISEAADEYLELASDRYGEYADETAEAIDFVTGKLNDLSEAYSANYESAYQSISDRLGLFNDVEIGTSKSTDEMIESLKKQTDYMAEYGAYMYRAMELGVDEGILKQLSDGSEESAGILKEMVTNGADKIAELNANFAKVEEGKKTFAAVMGELETYYGTQLDNMVADLGQAVDDMKQYDAAYQGAEETCQGIIDGIDSKWDEVISKYSALSSAAASAFAPIGYTTKISGHANGTTYGENVYIAGENGPELIVGRQGSEVFPASETARILSAVMADRGMETGLGMAPQEVTDTIVQENKSSSTENKNLTLTIRGKGALDIGQSVSKKDLLDYMQNELGDAIANILFREVYEEGDDVYEF